MICSLKGKMGNITVDVGRKVRRDLRRQIEVIKEINIEKEFIF